MFSKKPEIKTDYDKVVGKELLHFLSRVEEIEGYNRSLKRFYERSDLKWGTIVTETIREQNNIKKELDNIQSLIMSMKDHFLGLISEFKNSAQREDYERLEKHVDAFPMVDYVTEHEFKKMLKERLS